MDYAPEVLVQASKRALNLRGATGDRGHQKGEKKLECNCLNSSNGAAAFDVLEIAKPAISVDRLNETGHTFVAAQVFSRITMGAKNL